ncbi:hypothetical protein LCGC14_0460940 [marine sediment metagenome]|uniref:Single-stranded DNA-binding protein n=1 Tax=marine sediment metagenome TaxID=412755 RepID=A0A0F9SXY0_9ZZZZ|nr:hypothetical protein [bacterium]
MDTNSLNSFTILGFVGQDARGYTSKKASRKFTVIDICTQEKYKNKPDPKIVWHKVQIWGTKMAPWAERAVKRGMMVLAKGRTDNHFIIKKCAVCGAEQKEMITDYKVEEFIILRGKKLEDPATAGPAPAAAQQVQAAAQQAAPIVEEDPY